MNMQRRSDERSKMLHKEIAKKLENNPRLWDIPKNNIIKWQKGGRKLTPAFIEWEHILKTKTRKQILAILLSGSEESTRLRSSSPFAGVLNENERKKIFELFSNQRKM